MITVDRYNVSITHPKYLCHTEGASLLQELSSERTTLESTLTFFGRINFFLNLQINRPIRAITEPNDTCLRMIFSFGMAYGKWDTSIEKIIRILRPASDYLLLASCAQ